MSRTQLQVFLVVNCGVVALFGLGVALDPDGSVVGGAILIAASVVQMVAAVREEAVPPRAGRGSSSETRRRLGDAVDEG